MGTAFSSRNFGQTALSSLVDQAHPSFSSVWTVHKHVKRLLASLPSLLQIYLSQVFIQQDDAVSESHIPVTGSLAGVDDDKQYRRRSGIDARSASSSLKDRKINPRHSDDFVIGAFNNSSNSSQENVQTYNSSEKHISSDYVLRVSNSSIHSKSSTSNVSSGNLTSSDNSTLTSSTTYNVGDNSSVGNSQTKTSTSTNSTLANVFASNAMKQNNLYLLNTSLGFLPDDGSSGGSRTTMAQLNAALGSRSAGYGWYAQATSGTTFDGSQLLAVIDDVKACNCVFQPAVMPTGGWKGLTESDNSQAVAITFSPFYQTDGTYQGTADDFKKGWAAVAAAVKSIAPEVQMWWTPNVASAENYAQYEPGDLSTVDLVGVDYYPKELSGSDFVDTMQAFHDKYAVDGRMFAIGETGLGWAGSIDDKFKWLAEIVAAKSSMPQFLSMSWFNFQKEYDYKVAGESSLNQKFISLIAS
ncbi:hypothetical protein CROQUDRAFT_715091 [Cronartium quercuum f. sp. fusiforme G11]|uniref:GH26 domain-containing protein n=1 Tax=Cronartium quercuum f. sp. fusiforme G11 TaxID=708437 RepID=A0A9P6NK39_9BASI|nr:hypothetical protein CROQUDRAFT_715091 [Cronartium quercuum f. sp. fusiforme G11]